ncbi:hypothetical protein HLK59_29300 [Streptomyces sp. S3(2020)]|uniref:hypothetical protein n=1 Tax=Streptomyces sp. S3(2020) TaxID=2732044 RepID=UPI0014881C72|nr:hypothetical protein [Streptomyces sp. S3(2020)]NNN34388.1 hypothetical protein [Streptomyces sp. S3(2020)]
MNPQVSATVRTVVRLDRRFAALLTYAVVHGDAQPVDVQVRLLPPCDCPKECPHTEEYREYLERKAAYEAQGVPVTPAEVPAPEPCSCPDVPPVDCPHCAPGGSSDTFPTKPDLSDVPPGGLTQRIYRSLSFEEARRKVRDRLRGYGGQMPPHVRERLQKIFEGEFDRPAGRGGRPGRSLLEVLDACDRMEQGAAAGKTRAQVAQEMDQPESWLRNVLAWARKHEPPLLTPTLSGRRGDIRMTDEGRALLAMYRQREHQQEE